MEVTTYKHLVRWDRSRVEELARRAVDECGADRVTHTGECLYFVDERIATDDAPVGTPQCLVGQMLAYEGVSHADLGALNDAPVGDLIEAGAIAASTGAQDLLVSVQRYQDEQAPWGDALALALGD